MSRLVVQFPGVANVIIDGVVRGETNSVIQLDSGAYRVQLEGESTEPPEQSVVVKADADPKEIIHIGFSPAKVAIDRFSPVYCRYNGFLLGQFLSLAFASFARENYSERRSRMLEFLQEIEVDVSLPEEPLGLGGLEHVSLIQTVLKAMLAKSTELTQFTLLGALLTHHGLLAETDPETARDSLEQIEAIRLQYALPAIDIDRFAVDPEVRDPDLVLSPSLKYLGQIFDGMETEEETAFVIMPFKQPYAGYFATFYRPALEHAGYRAFRAWGGLKNEDYADLLLKLIEKVGLVWADVSEPNANVFYEIGAAHALDKISMLVVRDDLADSIPANIGHDAVIKYAPESAAWPDETVLLVAALISTLKLAAKRGQRLRVGPEALEQTLEQIGELLTGLIVPEEARSALEAGLRKATEGDAAGAEGHFDDAISLGLNDVTALLGRGTARVMLGRDAEGEVDLTELLDRGQDDETADPSPEYRTQASYFRGLARERQENYEGACEDYGTAIELGYPGAGAHHRRAFVEIELGRLEDARRDVDAAKRLAPDDPGTHDTEGDLLLAEERYEEAVASYDASLAVTPNANVEFTRALALLLAGRAADALAGYRGGVTRAQPDEARWALRDLERRAGGRQGAAECRAVFADA